MRFSNQSVLVTGAAGGIGRATALAFADEGAHLVVVDRQSMVEDTASACRERGVRATALPMAA